MWRLYSGTLGFQMKFQRQKCPKTSSRMLRSWTNFSPKAYRLTWTGYRWPLPRLFSREKLSWNHSETGFGQFRAWRLHLSLDKEVKMDGRSTFFVRVVGLSVFCSFWQPYPERNELRIAGLGGVAGLHLVTRVIFARVILSTQIPRNRQNFLSRSAFSIGICPNSDFLGQIRAKIFYCINALLSKNNPFWLLQHVCFSLSLEHKAQPNKTGS